MRRWLFVLMLLALPGWVAAQDADVLTGRVLDAEGKPVVGARVEAVSIETEISRSVLTDGNGRYMLLFPDGGGRYVLRVTMLGMADLVRTVIREDQEELLLTDVTLAPQAIELAGITVRAPPPPPGQGNTGEQTTDLPQSLLNRLPLPDLDPTTLALLAAGVTATQLDSLSGRMGFSVAGMSELLNQITLDGTIVGEGGLQVPEEGVRRTQVTTSTFDVSRGGFAGGQVSMTSARGNNRTAGSLSYRFDDDALQSQATALTNAFTTHNIGGSIGGPIVRNRLFYNVSFGLQRTVNHRFALAADDAAAAQRAGVSVDSITRFLDILGGQYGVPTVGQTGPYDMFRENLNLQSRVDWNIAQSRTTSQTLSLRVNTSMNGEDSTRISAVDLAQHGGELDRNNRLGSLQLTSRFGGSWTNSLRASYSESWNEQLPYLEMPEGRVRITSDFDNGTRETSSLVFGGNRSMPTEGYNRNLQLQNDLSFMLPIGSQIHRLKVGGSLEKQRQVSRSTDNLFGAFTFSSLDDFAANRPERYERSLAPRDERTGTLRGALYLGDTWRISQPFEVTLGLRYTVSQLDQRPAYNPVIEQLFGRRTDIDPRSSFLEPRIGFSYRLNQQGQPTKSLSGGIGYFAGNAPTNIFSAATRQTGLPDAEQRLVCIGAAVPVPDWELYAIDPFAVPESCADGGPGVPDAFSQRAPTVTLIDPDQSLPASLRVDLGYRTRVPFGIDANIRYQYARGFGLWGYRDVNLDEAGTFTIANDGRPFFGDVSAIVPGSGAVSMTTSRLHEEFGNVYDVLSGRESSTHQLTARLNGYLFSKLMVNANYTLGFSRDQASGSFGQATTAGNPNEVEWGTSGNDRRHNINLTFAYPITPEVELSLMSRLTSGSPFTPMIDRDINGDGVRNDRAFVFDPATAGDPAIASAMDRLLESVPGRVADCLESQMGEIAGRNSCRNAWAQSLDFRVGVRPNLPRLSRRLTISIDGRNALTGLDQLVHGKDGMRGWGEGARAQSTLLQVRGFDPVTRSFRYEVNEGFGQTNRGPNSVRNPFYLTISARLAIGGQDFQNNRGFGPMTAGAGRGGPGGDVPAFGGPGGRGPGGGAQTPGGQPRGFNAVGMLDRMLANPIPVLLALKDTLGLTAEQVARIDTISAELQTKLNARREELGKRFDSVQGDQQVRVFQEVQPQIEESRTQVRAALEAVQKVLTAEQWERVPERVRNPFQQTGPRRGGG